ncbi:hypothetical protein DCAR_0415166 [Daucus carota subsp. sativus]|nr:hypothetical protein DCAR_0415166 [Daucus carota subsp. sativus]
MKSPACQHKSKPKQELPPRRGQVKLNIVGNLIKFVVGLSDRKERNGGNGGACICMSCSATAKTSPQDF